MIRDRCMHADTMERGLSMRCLRHPYFGLLPLHLELYLAAEGARVCGAADEGVGVVVDRGLVTTANENSTELLVRTLLLLCSMKQQQQQQQRRQQREGAPYVS